MTTPTREEMDARLDAVEARLETRLVSLDAKLDLMLDKFSSVQQAAIEAKESSRLALTATSSVKWTIIGMGVALFASVLGVLAFAVQIADFITHLVKG